MSNEVITVDAETEQNSVGNITAEDFAIQRLGQTQGEPAEDTQEVQEEEVLEEAVESEEEVIQETENEKYALELVKSFGHQSYSGHEV